MSQNTAQSPPGSPVEPPGNDCGTQTADFNSSDLQGDLLYEGQVPSVNHIDRPNTVGNRRGKRNSEAYMPAKTQGIAPKSIRSRDRAQHMYIPANFNAGTSLRLGSKQAQSRANPIQLVKLLQESRDR